MSAGAASRCTLLKTKLSRFHDWRSEGKQAVRAHQPARNRRRHQYSELVLGFVIATNGIKTQVSVSQRFALDRVVGEGLRGLSIAPLIGLASEVNLAF